MKTKANMSYLLAVLLALSMLFIYSFVMVSSGSTNAYAATNDDKTNSELYDEWTDMSEEPSDYSKSVDPYGYGIDVPFYMNKVSELVLYDVNSLRDEGNTPRDFHSYNLTSNIGENVLLGAEADKTYRIPFDETMGKQIKELNYVKVEAFDPTGSGRKDHVAVLGVHNEKQGANDGTKTLYLYVYDKEGQRSDYLKLGELNWMGQQYGDDAHNCWLLNAMNFLGITSGDYDGDNMDSLVIWGCFDGTGYGLQEVTVKETEDKITLNSSGVSRKLLHDVYGVSVTELAESTYVDNKLCCALDTGDVNGDKIDDLVVLSYVDITTANPNGQKQQTSMYRPLLSVSYGKKALASVVENTPASAEVWKKEDSGNQYTSSFGNGLSVGDIDGDGYDEVVTAGMLNTVTGTPTSTVNNAYNFDKGQIVVSAYKADGKNLRQAAFETKAANEWTKNAYYPGMTDRHEDRILPQYGVECAAINGMGNPELIFINGYIYSFSAAGNECFTEEYAPEYFANADTTSGFSNKFIGSVVSGNFDGNKYGYEQLVFVNARKVSNHERYHMILGIIGGNHGNDTSGIAGSYYTNATNSVLRNSSNYFPREGNVSANLSDNFGYAYTICAADTDEDGVIARFHRKGYTYSDPDILAVIQAPPQFDELSKYAEGSETEYSFTESTTLESGKSDSVSFGAGVTHSLEGTLGGYDLKAGYAMDWSQEFTKGITTEYTYTYKADEDDLVVMYRTPITLYGYQLKKKDGSWSDGDETLVLSFPGEPAYSNIDFDTYNEFAKYYNKVNAANVTAGKTPPTLPVLNEDDLRTYYLGTGGDPAKYMNINSMPTGAKILQRRANVFNVSSGSTGFSYGTESYTSNTESMSHGFSFELTISFGLGIPGFVDSSAGVYASLEYMHGKSYTTASAKGKGASCSIKNASKNRMLADDFSTLACSSYRFKYQMAEWNSPFTRLAPEDETPGVNSKIVEKPVPIYGYVLSEVKTPEYAVIKAPGVLTLYEGYDQTTTGAFMLYGDPVPTVSKISGNDKIIYNETTRKLTIKPGLANGTYTVELKADNGIPSKKCILAFTIKVVEPDFSENGIIESVKNKIDNLPGKEDLLLSDEIYVQQARTAYNGLTDTQKNSISEAQKKKLEAAEQQIQGFKDAVTALEKAVSDDLPAVKGTIDNLNNSSNLDDSNVQADVQAVQAELAAVTTAYNAMSYEQKAEVSEETVGAINAAVQAMAELASKVDGVNMEEAELKQKQAEDKSAAAAVEALIKAIDLEKINSSDVNTDEESFQKEYQEALATCTSARKAYDQLTFAQMGQVKSDNLNILIAAEKALGSIITDRKEVEVQKDEEAAVTYVINKINALPTAGNLKFSDRNNVFAAKRMYDSLTAESKAKVPAELVTKLNEDWEKAASLRTANTMTAKGKTVKLKYKTLKKTVKLAKTKAFTIKNPQGTVTFKKLKGNKKITVNKKTGEITVKKGLKKGTYKVAVSVTASGNQTYKKATKKVTVTIRVR